MSRIEDKIDDLIKYLNELELIIPDNIDEYLDNIEKK